MDVIFTICSIAFLRIFFITYSNVIHFTKVM